MLVKNKKQAYRSLFLFSFLSFIFWRIEVEYHGWHGLTWLSYYHLAIPASLFLFLLWINIFFDFGKKKNRIKINILLIFWMVVGTISISYFLVTSFQYRIGGFSSIVSLFEPFWKSFLRNINQFILVPFFPIIALLSLRFVKIRIPITNLFGALLLYLLAFPIAIFLLNIIPQRGTSDLIHAVKTGFVFPFLFFSLGMPLIYSYWANQSFKKVGEPAILDDF